MNKDFYIEVLEAVENINQEAFGLCPDFPPILSISTDATALIVEAFGTRIYHSEDEPRPFNESLNVYQTMYDFLRQALQVHLSELRLLDFDGKGERYEKEHVANEAYRTAISTFLDEADAGGTPSYAGLRAVLKQYK